MKMVQSFWSKPFILSQNDDLDDRRGGGWKHMRYYLMSWALSSLQLIRLYKRVELVTDNIGKNILVDWLGLPYCIVHTDLENISNYRPDIWCLGKIYAYGMQTESFLHVDSDVFIWEKFPSKIENANLAVQHKEIGYDFYQKLFSCLSVQFNFMPPYIDEYRMETGRIDAYNMGIAGGNNSHFYRMYKENAFEFLDKNINNLQDIPIGHFNTFLEQVLFLCLAHRENAFVNTLIPFENEKEIIEKTQGFNLFVTAPKTKRFIHLYGYCKRNELYCLELERIIRSSYPGYYEKIIKLCGKNSDLLDIINK